MKKYSCRNPIEKILYTYLTSCYENGKGIKSEEETLGKIIEPWVSSSDGRFGDTTKEVSNHFFGVAEFLFSRSTEIIRDQIWLIWRCCSTITTTLRFPGMITFRTWRSLRNYDLGILSIITCASHSDKHSVWMKKTIAELFISRCLIIEIDQEWYFDHQFRSSSASPW